MPKKKTEVTKAAPKVTKPKAAPKAPPKPKPEVKDEAPKQKFTKVSGGKVVSVKSKRK